MVTIARRAMHVSPDSRCAVTVCEYKYRCRSRTLAGWDIDAVGTLLSQPSREAGRNLKGTGPSARRGDIQPSCPPGQYFLHMSLTGADSP